MSRIRILAENVANKIAAGEVVERPASVVKELLENALDAGARSIRIETESGGKRMIRVIDDGTGMNHDDALLAFERHATSKLRTADDLLSISTLGFRGEALPSIASISRLLLETRSAEDEQGTRVEFAGGKLISVKPAGLPAGTSISVADIFYCVPARRKFLKSETTELGHIASLVTHYALAHPDCQFLLKTPTQEILNCTPVEKLSERRARAQRHYRAAARSRRTGRYAARDWVHFAAGSAAHESQRDLHFREPPTGPRPVATACDRRGISQHYAARSFSLRAVISGIAVRGSGRERPSRENRGALSASAIRSRFHSGRVAAGALACAADSGVPGCTRSGCGR
jgi:DNA mismatch repair protein MutL